MKRLFMFILLIMLIPLSVDGLIIIGTQANNSIPYPIVTTNAATSIGTSTATLNGTAYNYNSAGFYYFNYGTTTTLGTHTTQIAFVGNTVTTSFLSNLTGLSIGTTYYFQACVTNNAGISCGNTLTFNTNGLFGAVTVSGSLGVNTTQGHIIDLVNSKGYVLSSGGQIARYDLNTLALDTVATSFTAVAQKRGLTMSTATQFLYAGSSDSTSCTVSKLNIAKQNFTVTAANATAGATYTNNGVTFTVVSTIVASTGLTTTSVAPGLPTTSGTLTKASGTGDATITFSSWTFFPTLALSYVDGNDIGVFFDTTTSNVAQVGDEANANPALFQNFVLQRGDTLIADGTSSSIAPERINQGIFNFFVTSANATIAATYTHNTRTYTVVDTVTTGNILLTTGPFTPLASGTLTKASGSGDTTIPFSSFFTLEQLISFGKVGSDWFYTGSVGSTIYKRLTSSTSVQFHLPSTPNRGLIVGAGGYVYIGTASQLLQIDTGLTSSTALTLISGATNIYDLAIDTTNNYLFYATNQSPVKIGFVDLTTFTNTDVITLPSTFNTAFIQGALQIDVPNKFLYYSPNGMSPAKVAKIAYN